MKVIRTRYGESYQYAEYYGEDPATTEPRMFWRDSKIIDEFEDADVRQLGDNSHWLSTRYQLRVPMKDPETGDDTDVDGDRSLLRIVMVGGTVDFYFGHPTFKGFVSLEELDHEKAYREGDLYGCVEAHGNQNGRDNIYVREEWLAIHVVSEEETT